jgi:hypothetical protein
VEGLAIDRTQIFPDAKSMARAMSQIAFSRPPLAHYTAAMEKSWRLLGNSVSAGLKSLMWSINQQVIELIVDLRGQAKASKPLILLSVFTLAREAKDNVRTRILVSEIEPWLRRPLRLRLCLRRMAAVKRCLIAFGGDLPAEILR